MSWSTVSAILMLAALGIVTDPAHAQQMGRDGYSFPARSPSLAAQFEFQQRMQNGSAASSSTAAGLGALTQYVTQYNSSSTSIANMSQVNQTVGNGSTATTGQTTSQTSTGNQDSAASTDTSISTTITHPAGQTPPTQP